jgi:hypothetical protein
MSPAARICGLSNGTPTNSRNPLFGGVAARLGAAGAEHDPVLLGEQPDDVDDGPVRLVVVDPTLVVRGAGAVQRHTMTKTGDDVAARRILTVSLRHGLATGL